MARFSDRLLEAPSAELAKGKIWHIGNVRTIDNNSIYFRVGRTTKSKVELYKNGNFIDTEFETSPYTHVLMDVFLEVFAIAKKTKISSTVFGIARQFMRLINEYYEQENKKIKIEIGIINDPDNFIKHIKKAYRISKYWVTFSRPNPFDVNKDYIEPAEKLLKAALGEKGKTELLGQNLDPITLEELTRSAAASGNDAAAWIQSKEETKGIKKNLKGNPIMLEFEDVADDEQRNSFISKIRNVYKKIRNTLG